jgi:hypothetical protein
VVGSGLGVLRPETGAGGGGICPTGGGSVLKGSGRGGRRGGHHMEAERGREREGERGGGWARRVQLGRSASAPSRWARGGGAMVYRGGRWGRG